MTQRAGSLRTSTTDKPQALVLFRHCWVLIWHERYLETRFEDDTCCPAMFTSTDDNKRLAVDLGYGDDVNLMHLDHELGHTYLAEAAGLLFSPVLRGVAVPGDRPDSEARAEEEGRVLAFQWRLSRLSHDPRVQAYLSRFHHLRGR